MEWHYHENQKANWFGTYDVSSVHERLALAHLDGVAVGAEHVLLERIAQCLRFIPQLLELSTKGNE